MRGSAEWTFRRKRNPDIGRRKLPSETLPAVARQIFFDALHKRAKLAAFHRGRERSLYPILDLRERHRQIGTGTGRSEHAMEDVVLLLLALTAAYLVVQIIVEAYMTIDHALMTRKQRRK